MLHDKRIDGLVKRVSHVLQDKRDRERQKVKIYMEASLHTWAIINNISLSITRFRHG